MCIGKLGLLGEKSQLGIQSLERKLVRTGGWFWMDQWCSAGPAAPRLYRTFMTCRTKAMTKAKQGYDKGYTAHL
eukprot:scaffold123117_cov18-Tisochrysis_lutea.AAC.1